MAGGATNRDAEILDEAFANVGAVVLGKRMYDNANGWGENPPFHVPVFVLAHDSRKPLVKEGGTTFTFVADGIESALKQARASADDRDILVAGGANTTQQFMPAGLLDEIQLHLVPVLLGGGIRVFDHLGAGEIDLEQSRLIGSAAVTHLRYRVAKDESQPAAEQ